MKHSKWIQMLMRIDGFNWFMNYYLKIKEIKSNFLSILSIQIAFRAALLEQENAILRAQILALREELATLQQMICNRANI